MDTDILSISKTFRDIGIVVAVADGIVSVKGLSDVCYVR